MYYGTHFAALGVINPPYNPSCNFDFVKVEIENEVWTSSSGKTKEEPVAATVTFDVPNKDATYFSNDWLAKDCLETLLLLDRHGKVTLASYAWGPGASTPGLSKLGVFRITDTLVPLDEIKP